MPDDAAPRPVAPSLDSAAIGALCAAVVGAFNADELYEVALVDVDEDLFVTYGTRETPLDTLTLAFLAGLRRRGIVPRFLRAARKRRPDNVALVAAITRYCPAAMQDEEPASAQVGTLIVALDLMRARLANPDVASAVGDSQDDLGSLADRLARLRTYKGLHDTLQDFQVSRFSSLRDYVKRLRVDTSASDTLRDLLTGFLRTFKTARMTLQPLEAAHDDVEEKNCLDEFVAAFGAVSDARYRLDDRAAWRAVLRVRALLQTHPSRINGALRSEARRLPLKGLTGAIAVAARSAGLTPDQRSSLEDGARSIDELRLRLARNVTDHDRWQAVERHLWFLDDTADRGDGALDEFRDYWDIAKDSIAPLWNADVQAAWVGETGGFAKAVDAALAADPPDPAGARSRYGDFRHAAMWRFFDVDGELRDLCEDVLQIGAPVAMLLKGAP